MFAFGVLAGIINLKSSKTNTNKFERGKVDEFVVEAVDIGELKKIKYAFMSLLWQSKFDYSCD